MFFNVNLETFMPVFAMVTLGKSGRQKGKMRTSMASAQQRHAKHPKKL
jgi:hypothetical protein